MSEVTENNKKTVGRNKTALFNSMRAVAWVNDLKRRTGISGDEKLMNTVTPPGQVLDIRFGRYLSGKTVPSQMIRNFVHQYPPVAKSQNVYEIGPEENKEFIPFWMLFENRYEEYWSVIENVISLHDTDDVGRHVNRIDRLAAVFLPDQEWAAILEKRDFFTLSAEPLSNSVKRGFFKPELRLLAAVIALWRLSLFIRDGVAPMEYLLSSLLEEPYKEMLADYGIYDQVCLLVRAISVQHHALAGNIEAASRNFANLEVESGSVKP